MWAGAQTILSKDGTLRADFRAFADSVGFYRSIGAVVGTFKKVNKAFLLHYVYFVGPGYVDVRGAKRHVFFGSRPF